MKELSDNCLQAEDFNLLIKKQSTKTMSLLPQNDEF